MAETLFEREDRLHPLVINRFTSEGGSSFSAACFEGTGWSLGPLQKATDVHKNLALASSVRRAMENINATCAYAPNPTRFNGKIIDPQLLTEFLSLGNGIYLRRNQAEPADGTFLRFPREAGIFSAGGCGVVVMMYKEIILFAHAGRDCLLDRTWVKSEGAERTPGRNVSVIESMLNALQVPNEYLSQVHVWPLYFIKPDDFVHHASDTERDYGTYNSAAIRFLPSQYGAACGTVTSKEIHMDLPRIARAQCIQYGVSSTNVHMEHCYLADELPTTRNGGGRYLVAIVRNS
jgi:hypothetical protein